MSFSAMPAVIMAKTAGDIGRIKGGGSNNNKNNNDDDGWFLFLVALVVIVGCLVLYGLLMFF